MLFWQNGLFKVGPQSAGAHPGPACYGNGGPLTITDANCFLGRILPDYFPRPLDLEKVKKDFLKLTDIVNEEKHGDDRLTPEQVAMGFIQVANATMTRPIRTLSEGRGFETSSHNLACFGGAGGQHATAIARDLGIKRVLIHQLSSILSAYGMALADVVVEKQEPEAVAYTAEATPRINTRFDFLSSQAEESLKKQGFLPHRIEHELFLNMRYKGADTALMISKPDDGDFGKAFVARHHREFGFTQPRDILVDDIRVRSVGRAMDMHLSSPFAQLESLTKAPYVDPAQAKSVRKIYFEKEGWVDSQVYHIAELPKGCKVKGPAVAIDATQTIILDPASEATVLDEHLVIELLDTEKVKVGTDEVDPIQLSVFGHRFMSVAEQVCVSRSIRLFHTKPRSDGPNSSKDFHIHQHQGAARLQLCCILSHGRAGGQRSPYPWTSRLDEYCHQLPGQAVQEGRIEAWRRHSFQSPLRWRNPFTRLDRYHACFR